MKLPDANVLLYAVDDASPDHEAARGWLEARLSGSETIAFSWVVLLAFVRLGTHPRLLRAPRARRGTRPRGLVACPADLHGANNLDRIKVSGTFQLAPGQTIDPTVQPVAITLNRPGEAAFWPSAAQPGTMFVQTAPGVYSLGPKRSRQPSLRSRTFRIRCSSSAGSVRR